ncbi:POTRA domain-containing protein [Sulfuricurvum sp.]|uniref:POTRA domain-containing protein n=1 Tax=Sulfuricurvum sp. TaxID=2025608 RepID=UPI002E33809C|nr:POTRA domain-containing protein [Sulfuricurvum sp.]HEX5329774.1 POTRA domain-containing protein [Sulfuricurvum sp.]
MLSKTLLAALSLSVSLLASTPIKTITFEGNVKVPTKVLQKNIQHHLGKVADTNELNAIITETEAYYRNHNYALAFATVESMNDTNGTLKVVIGKYADFNARSIAEMKRRKVQEGSINQIFFEGNEKISTYRLMKLIAPSLGKTNTTSNLNDIALNVQNYYRQHRYELAYAQIKNIDDKGVVTVEIKKYPNFKALYAREKKQS